MHDAQLKSRTKPGNFSANLCLKHPRVSATPALWRKTNNHSAPALYLTARVGGKRCRVSFRAKALFRQDSAHHRRCRQDKHAHAVKNTVQKSVPHWCPQGVQSKFSVCLYLELFRSLRLWLQSGQSVSCVYSLLPESGTLKLESLVAFDSLPCNRACLCVLLCFVLL